MSTIQTTPAWQLEARIGQTPYGHHLVISSYVPTARRPECWRQFKIDHLCQLNFDQGSKAGIVVPSCG